MRPAHPGGLLQSHRLAGQMPERKFDCFCLGPDSVAAHDRLDVVVLDFSGSSSSCHAAIVQQGTWREWVAGWRAHQLRRSAGRPGLRIVSVATAVRARSNSPAMADGR